MKKLIDYVVDDLIDDGVPLTRDGIKDLLAVMSPAQITPLTASQAILADRMIPSQLVFEQFRDVNWQTLADRKVRLRDSEGTVAELLHEGDYPLDFVLAGVRLPSDVCRWYVLEYLSDTDLLWPNTVAELKTATLETKLSFDYIHEQVTEYLDVRPLDTDWLHILGIPGVSIGKIKTNRQLITSLLLVLRTGSLDGSQLDAHSQEGLEGLNWVMKDLGIKNIKHYKQVDQIKVAFDSFVFRMQNSLESLTADEKSLALKNIIGKLQKVFS